MSGIMIKELLVNKKQYILLGIIGAIYIVIGIMQPKSNILIVYVVVLGAMSTLSSFSFDENAKWDVMASALPVPRKKIVAARYLLAVILSSTAILLMLLYNVIFAIKENEGIAYDGGIKNCLMMLGGLLIYQGIVLPLMYKLGAERGRIVMLAAVMVPMVIIILFNKTDAIAGITSDENVMTTLAKIGTFLPIAGVAVIILSYMISAEIYAKKDM